MRDRPAAAQRCACFDILLCPFKQGREGKRARGRDYKSTVCFAIPWIYADSLIVNRVGQRRRTGGEGGGLGEKKRD